MKKDSVKYKASPLKGKRKLEYSTKSGRSGSVKLPLIGKTVYLDVKEPKHVKRLQADLKRLGGTIEEFVSRDINYLITTQPRPKRSKSGRECEGDSPVPSPFNCDPSPSPGNPDTKKPPTVTRGKALAEKARVRTKESNNLVENAEKWGVKIVSLEGAYKWIERELKKLPKQSLSHVKKHHKSDCVAKYKTLKGPYLKIEASSFYYRPLHHELETWPRLNVDTVRGSCPFDGTLIKGGDQSVEERGDLLAAQVDRPSEEDTPNEEKDAFEYDSNTPKPAAEKSTKKSEQESAGGSRILTAGEIRRQKEIKRKLERKRGYCECCQLKYEDLDKHVRDEQHRAYIKDKSHYETLDQLIHSGPSAVQFISGCLSKAVSLRQPQKPASKEACEEEEVALISPMKVAASPQRKRMTAAVNNSPRKDVSPSKRKPSSAAKTNNSHHHKDSGNKVTKDSSVKSKENKVPEPKEKRENSKTVSNKKASRSPMVETVQYVHSNTINSKNLCTNDTKIVKRTSPRKSLRERNQENQEPEDNAIDSFDKVAVRSLRSPRNKHVDVEGKVQESRTGSKAKGEDTRKQSSSPKPNRCLSALFDKEKKSEVTGRSVKSRTDDDSTEAAENRQLPLRETKTVNKLAETLPGDQKENASATAKVKDSQALHKKQKVVETVQEANDSSIKSKGSPAMGGNLKSPSKSRRAKVIEDGRDNKVECEDEAIVDSAVVVSNKTRTENSKQSKTRSKTAEAAVEKKSPGDEPDKTRIENSKQSKTRSKTAEAAVGKKSPGDEPDPSTAVTEVKAVMDVCNKRVKSNRLSDDFEVCLLKSIQKEKISKELDDKAVQANTNKKKDNRGTSDNLKKSKTEKKKIIEDQEPKLKKKETLDKDSSDKVTSEPSNTVAEVSEANEPGSGLVDPCLSDFTYLGLDGEIHVFTKTLAERIKERSRSRPMSDNSFNLESSFSTTICNSSKLDNGSQQNVNKSGKKCKAIVSSKKSTQAGIASKKVLSKYKVRRDSHRRHDMTQMGYQGDDERDLEDSRTRRRRKAAVVETKQRQVVTKDKKDEKVARKRPAKWFYVMESEVEESESDQRADNTSKTRSSRSRDSEQQNAEEGRSKSQPEATDDKSQPSNSRKKPSRFWFYEPEPASSGKDSENEQEHLSRVVKEKRKPRDHEKNKEKETFKEPDSMSYRTLKKSKKAPKYWYCVDSRIQTDEETESESNSERPNNKSNKKLKETENESDDLSDKPQRCKPENKPSKAKKFWYYEPEIIISDKQTDSEVEILPTKLRRFRDGRDSSVDSVSGSNRNHVDESRDSTNKSEKKSSKSGRKFWYYEPEVVTSEKDSEHEVGILPEKLRNLKGRRDSSTEGHLQSANYTNSRSNIKELEQKKESQSKSDKKSSRSTKKFWYYEPEVVTSEKETEDEVEIMPEKLRRRVASTAVASVETNRRDHRDRSLRANTRKMADCDDEPDESSTEIGTGKKNNENKVSDSNNKSRLPEVNSDSEALMKRKHGRRFWEYVPYVAPDSDSVDPSLPKELKEILKCPWNDVVGQGDSGRRRRTVDNPHINYDENKEVSEGEENKEKLSKHQNHHDNMCQTLESNRRDRSRHCKVTADTEMQQNENDYDSSTSEVISDTEVVKKKRDRQKFWDYVPHVESESDEVDPSLPKELQLLKCPWNNVVGRAEIGRRRNSSLDRKTGGQNQQADNADEDYKADEKKRIKVKKHQGVESEHKGQSRRHVENTGVDKEQHDSESSEMVQPRKNKNAQHDQESRKSDINSDVEEAKKKKDRRKFWNYVPLEEPESDDDDTVLPKELQILKCPWNNVVDQTEGGRRRRNNSLDRRPDDTSQQIDAGVKDLIRNGQEPSKSHHHKDADSKLRDKARKTNMTKERENDIIESSEVEHNVNKKNETPHEHKSKLSKNNSDAEAINRRKHGRRFWDYVTYVEPENGEIDPSLPKELQILKSPWNDVVGQSDLGRRRRNDSVDRNAEDQHSNMDLSHDDSDSTVEKRTKVRKQHSSKSKHKDESRKQKDEARQSQVSSDAKMLQNKSECSEAAENLKKREHSNEHKSRKSEVKSNKNHGRRFWEYVPYVEPDSDSVDPSLPKELQEILKCPWNDAVGNSNGGRRRGSNSLDRNAETKDSNIDPAHEDSDSTVENQPQISKHHKSKHKNESRQAPITSHEKEQNSVASLEVSENLQKQQDEQSHEHNSRKSEVNSDTEKRSKKKKDGKKFWEYVPCTEPESDEVDPSLPKELQILKCPWNDVVGQNDSGRRRRTVDNPHINYDDNKDVSEGEENREKRVRTDNGSNVGSDKVQNADCDRDNDTRNKQSPTKKSEKKKKKKLISVTLEENIVNPTETIKSKDTKATCKQVVPENRTTFDGSSSPKFHKKRKLSPKPSDSELEERPVSPVFQVSPAAKRRRECDKTVEQLSNGGTETESLSFEVKARNTVREVKSLVRLDKDKKHSRSPVKLGKIDTGSVCSFGNNSPLTTPTKKIAVETPKSGYSSTSRESRRKQWKRKRSDNKLNSSLNSSESSDQDKKKRKLEKLKYKLGQDSGDRLRLKSPSKEKENKKHSLVKSVQGLDKDAGHNSSPNRNVKTSLESSFELNDKSDKLSNVDVKRIECNKSGNNCVQTLPLLWEPSVNRGLPDQGQTLNTVNQQPSCGASGGVVRLNQSWSLLSDRSASKLLSSENDRESFHGFSEEEIDKDVPSDLTYVQCSEMDVAPDSEHEWTIEKQGEHDSDENSEKDEFVKYLPPTFSSPGKRSDSSWLDACEDYIDKSLRKDPKDSSFNYSLTSPWRSPLKKSKSSSKHGHASRECSTPKKSANSGLNVEKVDQEIEFNFSSPQKRRGEFSPLRYQHGRVVDTSKSHSEKSRTVKQGQKSRNLQLGDVEFASLRFSRLDDDDDESDGSVNNVKEFKLLKKVSSNKKKYSLTFDKSPVKTKKHKKSV